MSFNIRNACADDVDLILQFILELAKYEKLQHEVAATKQLLKKNLFCANPRVFAAIAEVNEEPIGFAIYFYNFSTFLGKHGLYIEDIYIKKNYRNKGYGKKLLAYLANIALENDCARMEWWVLDWNMPSIEFYKKIGATPMEEWTVQRLTDKDLKKLANCN